MFGAGFLAIGAILAAPAETTIGTRNTTGPVVVVGIDGMTFDVLDPLLAAGKLPTFAHILERGAHGVLTSERPMRSPALWTTIATGQPREVHGIYDFVTGSQYWPAALRGSEERLVTSNMRHAPAIWQIAGGAERTSLVVGWLNTWPAEEMRGVMVAPYVALGEWVQTSIKGRIYANAKHQTYPEDEFAGLRDLVASTNGIDPALVAQIVDEPAPGDALYSKVPHLKRYLYTVRWSLAAALTNAAIVKREVQRRNFDLVMLYFDGADTLAHRFWLLREDPAAVRTRLTDMGLDPELAQELKARLGFAVDGYYQVLDQLLAGLIDAAGKDATVVLVSDHGWGTAPGKRWYPNVPFDGEHRLEGVFIAAGPHIQPGTLPALSLYDVAPTLLYLLGVGVPVSLPGRIVTEVVDNAYAAAHPPLLLAIQKATPVAPTRDAGDSPFRAVEIDRLRSLGYVQ